MVQQLINALVLGSAFALFAIGLSLAWGTLDVLNLAHGAIFVFGAYAAYRIGTAVDAPFVAVVILGAAAAGVIAVLMELIIFRPIRARFQNKRQAELSMLVGSIGAGVIIDRVIANGTGSTVFSVAKDAFEVQRHEVSSLAVSNIQIIIVVSAICTTIALDLWVRRSTYGRAIRGIAYDHKTCSLLGVPVHRVAGLTMFVSGALAGLAGVLIGVATVGQDVSVGHAFLLKGFAVLILGGVGSIRGAFAAALLVGLAETAAVAYGPGSWRDAVAFALIIVVLLLRPQGLFARTSVQRA